MNPDEARELLGLSEEELPDEEAQQHIEAAKLFKDIFFDMLKKGELIKK